MGQSIVIVGGGVIGLCTAYYAMLKGHSVTVLERGAPDHDSCSQGNAGYITPSHIVPLAAPGMPLMGLKMMLKADSPFHIQPRLDADLIDWSWKFLRASTQAHVEKAAPLIRDLNMASRRLYIEYTQAHGNDFALEQRGLLMLCKTEKSLEEEKHLVELAHRVGMEASMLTADETAKLEPNLRLDIAGATYFPSDCHLSPRRFMATLTRNLQEGGVHFVWNATATDWRTADGSITAVQTTQGDFSGDEYVIAGGSWSPQVARKLGVKLPMQAGKGYSFTLTNPSRLPRIPTIFTEARIAVTPMGDTLQFGGTMDVTGLEHADTIQEVRVEAIRRAIPHYFPDFTPQELAAPTAWTGLRPCSPDGLPYIGRTKRWANLCVATGHAMMGMSLGPITGKLIAEVVSGETPEIGLDGVSPDRYG